LYAKEYLLQELARLSSPALPNSISVYFTMGAQEISSLIEGLATHAAFQRVLALF
jgi:hypothetical protein